MRYIKFIIVALSFVYVQSATGASFDCNKARSVSEKLICSDPELSAMDDKLFEIYKRAKEVSNNSKEFREEQGIAWKYREQNCTDKQCIAAWYKARNKHYAQVVEQAIHSPISNVNSPELLRGRYICHQQKLYDKSTGYETPQSNDNDSGGFLIEINGVNGVMSINNGGPGASGPWMFSFYETKKIESNNYFVYRINDRFFRKLHLLVNSGEVSLMVQEADKYMMTGKCNRK
jgi:uncharacterized protein